METEKHIGIFLNNIYTRIKGQVPGHLHIFYWFHKSNLFNSYRQTVVRIVKYNFHESWNDTGPRSLLRWQMLHKV